MSLAGRASRGGSRRESRAFGSRILTGAETETEKGVAHGNGAKIEVVQPGTSQTLQSEDITDTLFGSSWVLAVRFPFR